MKRLLTSILTIGVIASVAVGATRAFFSDRETSTGNVLSAGSIDLKVDSTAHYAGLVCSLGGLWVEDTIGVSNNTRPELLNTVCTGTWESKDLTNEKFFNLTDIKPGDMGENTLSLTVQDNDAWACIQINNLQNNENTLVDPEAEAGDVTNDPNGGELAQNLYFTAWLDQGTTPGWQNSDNDPNTPIDPTEGDNIWQGNTAEPLLFTNQQGPASDVLGGQTYKLADSTTGFGPLVGLQTNYIGLAWCGGQFDAVAMGLGNLVCNGSFMGNNTQTDSITADLSIYVEQARNNPNFTCASLASPIPVPTGI